VYQIFAKKPVDFYLGIHVKFVLLKNTHTTRIFFLENYFIFQGTLKGQSHEKMCQITIGMVEAEFTSRKQRVDA
jgi:hypothetical protein